MQEISAQFCHKAVRFCFLDVLDKYETEQKKYPDHLVGHAATFPTCIVGLTCDLFR